MIDIYNRIYVKGTKQQLVNFINKSDNIRVSSFEEILDINKNAQTYDEITCDNLTLCAWIPLYYKYKHDYPYTLIRWIDDEKSLIQNKFPNDWKTIVSAMHFDDLPTNLLIKVIYLYEKWIKDKQSEEVEKEKYIHNVLGILYDVFLLDFTFFKVDDKNYCISFTCTTGYMIQKWLYAMQQEFPELTFALISQEEVGEFITAVAGDKTVLFNATDISSQADENSKDWDDVFDQINYVYTECLNVVEDYLIHNIVSEAIKNNEIK